MNLPSSFNDDNELFLSPLSSDSPWYPQNIDKVKELLNKLNVPNGNLQQLDEEQQNIYRDMLKPHHPELLDAEDDITYDKLQLVTAEKLLAKNSKIPKLALSANIKDSKPLSQTSERHGVVESNPTNSIQSSGPSNESSVATLILDAAENEQLLKEDGAKLILDLNGIDNENDKMVVYSTITRSITTEKLNNIIRFLFNSLKEENLSKLNVFVENVVFKSVLGQDLAQYSSFLPLIIDLLGKDEKFVVEQFLVP